MIKVIIADDHAVVRTGLHLIFDTTNDIVLAKECTSGNELLREITNDIYHVVILDICMPGKDALDVLNEIKHLHTNIPVVIFTMNSEKGYALRFLKNGADAYISKEADPSLLIKAIRTVAEGKKYYTDSQTELLLNCFNEKNHYKPVLHERLSDREFQVLCMLASGIKKDEIADILAISKNTVNNHRNNIMRKMEFESTSDLTRYAIENNIII